jgi:hypothetical protein
MSDHAETDEGRLDPASLDCLKKTRSGVLNVLVGVGVIVALTGLLLRGRAGGAWRPVPDRWDQAMYLGLILIFVASTVTRRALGRRARLRDPLRRCERFFREHLLPALVGSVAAPLGLVHGWLISPRLEAVLPFWITALVLGILAYPRGHELEGYDEPMASPRGPA